MPPRGPKSSKRAPTKTSGGPAVESEEQPKFYPLFQKRPPPADSNNVDKVDGTRSDTPSNASTMASNALSTEAEVIDIVSSPPDDQPLHPSKPTPPAPPTDAPSQATKFRSIFELPVPELPLSHRSSQNSLKGKGRQKGKTGAKDKSGPPGLSQEMKSLPTSTSNSAASTPQPVFIDVDEEDNDVVFISQQSTSSVGVDKPSGGQKRQPKTTSKPIKGRNKPDQSASTSTTPSSSAPVHPFFATRQQKRTHSTTSTANGPPSVVIIDDNSETYGPDFIVIASSSRPSSPGGTPPRSKPKFKTKTSTRDAPWPQDPSLQHTRGPQSVFPSILVPQRPRTKHLPSPHPQNTTLSDILPSLPPLPSTPEPPPLDSSALTPSTLISTIPPEDLSHPALARLETSIAHDEAGVDNSNDLWTHRWRPRRAEEVLGNEENAMYLRAWMQALELGPATTMSAPNPIELGKGGGSLGTKRPAIIRAVEKRKAPSGRGKKRRKLSHDGYGSDDWIVDDMSESDGGYGYDPYDEDVLSQQDFLSSRGSSPLCPDIHPPNPYDSTPSSLPPFEPLTNCMLIVGPHGSGKTASVYACAEELGWEVHEIWPGMGKRSAGAVASMVEGVSKNHVLGKTDAGDKVTTKVEETGGGGLKNFFTRAKDRGDRSATVYDVGTVGEPIVLDEQERRDELDVLATLVGDEGGPAPVGKAKPRQSLILIEEVDILFARDQNFWQAVIALISESKRPVVMTCNDSYHVPVNQLALQATLTFQAPNQSLLISYLRTLGLAHGVQVSPNLGVRLLQGTTYRPIGPDVPDHPVHPLPYQLPPTIDLRRAVSQLQFETRLSSEGSTGQLDVTDFQGLRAMFVDDWLELEEGICDWGSEGGQGKGVDEIWRFMDLVSTVDSHVNRRLDWCLEAQAIDRYDASLDDELGYTLLAKETDVSYTGIKFYNRDEEMALECLILGRKRMDEKHRMGIREETCNSIDREEAGEEATGAGPNGQDSPGGIRGEACQQSATSTRRMKGFDSRRLFSERAAYQAQVVGFLDEVINLWGCPLLPRPATVLDYVGMGLKMVEIDDLLVERGEEVVYEEGGRGGRPVRQSAKVARQQMVPRSGYERWITLSAHGAHAARASKLVWT